MMIPLTEQARTLWRQSIQAGDSVIDATAGNGHDTLLLAELVGETGRVFSFDNQASAIVSARARVQQAGQDRNVTWLCQGHESMIQHIPIAKQGRIRAVTFNLGYLPGGDKEHTTQTATTLAALAQSLELLMPGGLLSIIAYPGHPGGRAETEAIKQWAASLADVRYELTVPASRNKNAPEWIVVIKD